MGLAKKLAKRTQRLARTQKAKDAKRARRAAQERIYAAKHRENEINEAERGVWKDMQVVLYTALHEQNGFGGKRLTLLFSWVQNLAECVRDDYVQEDELLAQLMAETHYGIEITPFDATDDDSIKHRAIDRIMLYFLWILHDKFGFGQQRMKALHKACADIGSDLRAGRRTIHGMVKRLQRIKGFWLEERD